MNMPANMSLIFQELIERLNGHLGGSSSRYKFCVSRLIPRTLANMNDHAALKQFSQVPYFELKVPPPLCCACSEITARAQTSHVLAIWPSDMGCERLRRDMLNFDFAFTERSSYSLLSKKHIRPNVVYQMERICQIIEYS